MTNGRDVEPKSLPDHPRACVERQTAANTHDAGNMAAAASAQSWSHFHPSCRLGVSYGLSAPR